MTTELKAGVEQDIRKTFVNDGVSVSDRFADAACLKILQGDVLGAARFFELALKRDPEHLESNYNLGNLKYDEGDYSTARDYFKRAAMIAPTFPFAWFNLALSYSKLKKHRAASETLKKYETLNPNDGDIAKFRVCLAALTALEEK